MTRISLTAPLCAALTAAAPTTTVLTTTVLTTATMTGPALAGSASLTNTTGDAPALFAGPQDALEALAAGLNAPDGAGLAAVFGEQARDLLSSGNAERDAASRLQLAALLAEGYRFQPVDSGHVRLLLGAEGWPFPIPLARNDAGWAFDLEAGRDEVYFRRIGLNELDAIDMMRAYVAVQAEFRQTDHDGDGVLEFAQSLISSADTRDGLYWGDADSPLGVRIALADLDGHATDEGDQDPEPFGGYYFRVLQGQTDAAPGGALDYLVNDNMLAGHALLAVPSDYATSGIHSFMVSENGIVLQADLGEDSLQIAHQMRLYDPTDGWTPVE